ncbi:tetratricopeptide repeat protein [Streptomyces sp. CAI-121]|uniref:tetratricopeptide repeat protein n=1 Tax=unclassified Streptomyces TaxID=2593676 RepID=UPI0015872CC5|nr:MULTISPECIES: tetratricopeptide repeat protein [unclassified Streptomyces]NUV71507.1 tetratricopeptide repeat protein [Streptomyces sp. CAI-121]NUW17678.1 tetratricopeptide repeat protein [Streptomyces sp. CAI-68]
MKLPDDTASPPGRASPLTHLGGVLRSLEAEGGNPTPRELAELLWLAETLPDGTRCGGAAEGVALAEIPVGGGDSPVADAVEPHRPYGGKDPLHLPEATTSSLGDQETSRASAVRVGGAPSLPGRRALARALRPFKRRVPAPERLVMDEDATAEMIAETGRWFPVLRPGSARWLDVLLVVDDHEEGMALWDGLPRGLRTVLEETGAFRTVRTRRLRRRRRAEETPYAPKANNTSGGRTLTLLLTDGVDPVWNSRAGHACLRAWALNGPTAILHTLPERLWDQTAFIPEPGRFRVGEADGRSSSLHYSSYGLGAEPLRPGELVVPVLGLTPEWLAPWAAAVAHTGSFDGAGVRLPVPDASPDCPGQVEYEREAVAPRETGFDDFLAQAPPRVFRLCAYLATTSPLNLDLMRLIQATMLPMSPPSDLAEIVFSGLLRTRASEGGSKSYEFTPSVRGRLLATLRRHEARAVLVSVSAHARSHGSDAATRLDALVPDPQGPLSLATGAEHFAEVERTAPSQPQEVRSAGDVDRRAGGPEEEQKERPAAIEGTAKRHRPPDGASSEELADLDRAIELDPTDGDALVQRGEVYLLDDRYEEALADFNRAIELDATDGDALAHRGEVYRLDDREEEALADFNRAIEIAPEDAWALASRGQTYHALKRYEEALTDLNRAIEIDPTLIWALISRGQVYRVLRRYEEALTDFNRAHELDPAEGYVLAQRGEVYRLDDRYEEALTDFNRAQELDPANAWALASRGQTYHALKRYEEALADFNRAIELDPTLTWALLSRGQTHQTLKRHEEALADFNRVIELDPTDGLPLATRGLTHRALKRFEEALADFNRAIELDPTLTFVLTSRGLMHRALKRYEEALADFNRAIELDPEDTWALVSRGRTYHALKRHEEALADYNRAIELDPTDDIALASRGRTYRHLQRYDEALADYDRAIEIAPEDAWTLASRGRTYHALKRHEEALADYNRAIELDPTDDIALASRGLTYRHLQRYEEALADLDRAIELDPTDAYVLAQRGEVYRLDDRYEEALADFNRAHDLDPEDAWILASRGQTHDSLDHYQEALADYDRAIELDPEDPWILVGRGRTYHALDRYEEALADFNRAHELDPANGLPLVSRGLAHRALKRYEEALADFNRALELDPTLTFVLTSRGQTYRALKRYEEAVADFNRAHELDPTDGWTAYQTAVTLRLLNSPDEQRYWRKAAEVLAVEADALHSAEPPDRLEALGTLIAVRCALHEWDGAVEDLESFLADGPSSSSIREVLHRLTEIQQASADPAELQTLRRRLESALADEGS